MAEQPKKRRRSEKTKGLQCFALNCYSYRNRASSEDGISFHKFPDKTKNRELYDKWRINCGRDVEPSDASRICSKHFQPYMINRTLDKPQIRENAVPTIFDFPADLETPNPEKCSSQASLEALKESTDSNDKDQREPGEALEIVAMDHPCNLQEADLKQRLLLLQRENEELRKRIRNVTMREKRAKSTVQDLLQQLAEKEMINAQLEAQLEAYKDIPCELFGKASGQYSVDQRHFALALHLYSPKAYSYLRETMNVCLPAPRTLRKWLEKTDARPRFGRPTLESPEPGPR